MPQTGPCHAVLGCAMSNVIELSYVAGFEVNGFNVGVRQVILQPISQNQMDRSAELCQLRGL